MKGLRSTDRQLQNGHGDGKHSIGNVVITVCGAGWVLEMSGGPLWKEYDCLTTMLYT